MVADLSGPLPAPQRPPFDAAPAFAAVHVVGRWGFVSGHGPFDGDEQLAHGKVGADLSVQEGAEAARACGLAILATLAQELGDLDRVQSWRE